MQSCARHFCIGVIAALRSFPVIGNEKLQKATLRALVGLTNAILREDENKNENTENSFQ